MGEITVRKMDFKDIPCVADIEGESFSMPWSEKSFEESLKLDYGCFLVAELEEKIVGYAGMYTVVDEGDITNIAVSSEYRRRGVATALLTALVEEGRKQKLCGINLEVRESNNVAVLLYERFGFENLGTRRNFYEKPVENALIMRKIL